MITKIFLSTKIFSSETIRKDFSYMIKKTIKYSATLLLAFTVIFINNYTLYAENAQNWYCKREKEHLRPCIDPTMSYIEEENGFFIGKDPDEINFSRSR